MADGTPHRCGLGLTHRGRFCWLGESTIRAAFCQNCRYRHKKGNACRNHRVCDEYRSQFTGEMVADDESARSLPKITLLFCDLSALYCDDPAGDGSGVNVKGHGLSLVSGAVVEGSTQNGVVLGYPPVLDHLARRVGISEHGVRPRLANPSALAQDDVVGRYVHRVAVSLTFRHPEGEACPSV